MRLLEATGADIGLLFMLTAIPTAGCAPPPPRPGIRSPRRATCAGERHRLWRITEPAAVAHVQSLLAPASVIIADGHHRYETAVEYARAPSRRRGQADGVLHAGGAGTHDPRQPSPGARRGRLLAGRALPRRARRWFDVSPRCPTRSRSAQPGPARRGGRRRAPSCSSCATADAAASRGRRGPRAAWRRLAVSILHEGLLRPLLGIDDAKPRRAEPRGLHGRSGGGRRAAAREGRCQAAFLIAPTTPAELQAVVRGGELLPQKSTHFYPKLLDGLVFHLLNG